MPLIGKFSVSGERSCSEPSCNASAFVPEALADVSSAAAADFVLPAPFFIVAPLDSSALKRFNHSNPRQAGLRNITKQKINSK
ncbi:hypothetical protein [Propionivibrio sp.]|uniref:hypothetical protein n=1 Tax=Propionivibrio sp. TaxID=2212460 RepID=UPI0025E6F97E|nr:hypothetical protein [Propionivibrio sp.]